MNLIPNNSNNLNQTRPHPPTIDRMLPSTNYIDRIKYHHIDRTSPQSNRTSSSTYDWALPTLRERIAIDIGWWGWAGSFTISGIWR